MIALLVLLNNFLHDFSAAGWIFCSVLLWMIMRGHGTMENHRETMIPVLETILRLMRYSLLGIVLFGVLRAVAYRRYEWSAAAGDAQVWLLLIKHVFLTVVFLVGLLYYVRGRRLCMKRRT